MDQAKRRAVAVPHRFLHDDAYRAQVLAIADTDAAQEAEHDQRQRRNEIVAGVDGEVRS